MTTTHNLEEETAQVPHIIADTVLSEVEAFAKTPVLRRMQVQKHLVDRAVQVYSACASFRRKVGSGNRGRDLLYSFMRHWTAAYLGRHQVAIFEKLPADFYNGRPLPTNTVQPTT